MSIFSRNWTDLGPHIVLNIQIDMVLRHIVHDSQVSSIYFKLKENYVPELEKHMALQYLSVHSKFTESRLQARDVPDQPQAEGFRIWQGIQGSSFLHKTPAT